MKPLLFVLPFIAISFLNPGNNNKQSALPTRQIMNQQTGWYLVADNDNGNKYQLDKSRISYHLDPSPVITVKDIDKLAVVAEKNGEFSLRMKFRKSAASHWKKAVDLATQQKRSLAFLVKEKLVYVINDFNGAATDDEAIINREEYSKDELEAFRIQIEKEKRE